MVGRRVVAFIERMSLTSQGLAAVGAFVGMLIIGTVGFHYLESDWNWAEAFYFATYTLTTVGYGDLVPSTDLSRICASLYMIVGVTIALAALAIIGSNYITRREGRILDRYNRALENEAKKGPENTDRDEEDGG